ncbi:cobalamin binding intrinsic factor-like isoform 1-T1 [Acanthopagrus schlegelii]
MARRTAALLSVGLLLLATQGALTQTDQGALPVRVLVENDLTNTTPESYSSSVVEGGVLLGALRRLQEAQQDFKKMFYMWGRFTVKEDPDFGLLLESVNGVAGSERERTYWEILSRRSGEYRRLDVGIGCYKPVADEQILLRFTTWPRQL